MLPAHRRDRPRKPLRRIPSTPERSGGRSGSIVALVCLAALVAAATAAARPTARAGETISLLAPDYTDQTQAYWKSVIARFERANPSIAVELQMVHWTDINRKISTLVQTGH